jgi:hypothetical protein
MSARRSVGIVLVSGALVFATAGLSRTPWRLAPDDHAVIRLAWSGRPERLEICRRLSETELAERPAHMRQAVECEGTTASYRFQVWVDTALVGEGVLRGGGFRHDRPLYLLRDLAVPPGIHDLRVEMTRVESPAGDSAVATAADTAGLSLDRGIREDEERYRRRLEALPPALSLRQRVSLGSRQVVLVGYDSDARTLALKSGPGAGRP